MGHSPGAVGPTGVGPSRRSPDRIPGSEAAGHRRPHVVPVPRLARPLKRGVSTTYRLLAQSADSG